jgi:hypothetical protein
MEGEKEERRFGKPFRSFFPFVPFLAQKQVPMESLPEG